IGWRPASSTKSGKCMNPTDRVQKESQKKIKEQKTPPCPARAAVFKMKDPKRIIWGMDKLDEMELNPLQQPQLNEQVLKNKLKKLRETFEHTLQLYEKENPGICKDLRKLEVEYEQKRAQLSQHVDAVKNVMMMLFLAPVKMMALLRTRTNISIVTILMMVTPTDQMEKTAVRKRTQV
uniref:Wbp11/ELF5/Saf1 N-terminal domain-containing protein n=1 Tax=Theropithecus gelada TaxID=9565 RepID=A0A8D2GLB5_THEGE